MTKIQQKALDADEADVLGSNSKKINVGDHVLVKRDSVNFAQKGVPRKFARKTYVVTVSGEESGR